jgi:glycosyltransferase involved in cell wall biosynthesis
MRSILFFLPDLNGGGAQRTVVNLVNHMDRESFRPLLVLGSSKGPYREAVRADVAVAELGKERVRSAVLPLARRIRALDPDALFAPYPDADVALWMAREMAMCKKPMVLRESNHRTAEDVDWGFLKRHMVQRAYRRADRVVALSEGVRQDLLQRYGLRPEVVRTIYNPVDLESIRKRCLESPPPDAFQGVKEGTLRLIGIGRFVRQKGFDLLIRAVSVLREQPIHVTLLGEGPERGSLSRLAEELGIGHLVAMPGFQENPFAWMRQADIFVLSSRWEGFGHVIVEAMACGVPVVAASCLSGPDEIITDGTDGILFAPESVERLAESILRLLKKPEERKRLSAAGVQRAECFDARRVVREYEHLIGELFP